MTKDKKSFNTSITTFFLAIFVTLMLGSVSNAVPLSAKWYTDNLEVYQGETVKINLFVYPTMSNSIVTVSSTLMYDPEKLDFISTETADGWIDVSTGSNIITDTDNGMIRRTATIPNGASNGLKYITYIFTAKKAGETALSIEDGLALDANNVDYGLQQKTMTIKIDPAAVSLSPATEEKNKEDNGTTTVVTTKASDVMRISPVVNVMMQAEGRTAIYEGNDYVFDLRTLTSGDNLKLTEVHVDLLDESDKNIYSASKSFIGRNVETTLSVPKQYLKVGDYTLKISAIDQTTHEKFITEKSIGVLGANTDFFYRNRVPLLTSFMFICMIAALYHLHNDHVRERAMKKYYSSK